MLQTPTLNARQNSIWDIIEWKRKITSTSSTNQTHVLVASNNISLSCLEGRIYIITLLNPLPVLIILLNPLPVLVALKILRDRKLRRKSKTIPCYIPRIASSRLAYSSSIQCPKWMCLVLQRDSRSLSRKTVTQQTLRLGSNGFYIIFSDKFGL